MQSKTQNTHTKILVIKTNYTGSCIGTSNDQPLVRFRNSKCFPKPPETSSTLQIDITNYQPIKSNLKKFKLSRAKRCIAKKH